MLQLYAGGKLPCLNIKLAQSGVAAKVFVGAGIGEHGVGVIGKRAGHIDIRIESHTHNGLELPQAKIDGILGVVHIWHRIGYGSLGPGKIEFRGPLRVILLLGKLEILDGIVVNRFINCGRLLGQEHGKERFLDLGNSFQTGTAGLFDRKFNVLTGYLDAFPELRVNKGHTGRDARGPGVPAADFESVA